MPSPSSRRGWMDLTWEPRWRSTGSAGDDGAGGSMDQQPKTRPERRRLTHVDRAGRPRMVDVSDKPATARRAVAEALVTMGQETLSLIIDGGGPKGDVLSVAELAGVMGGKRTSDLIPLCHSFALTGLAPRSTPFPYAAGFRSSPE